LTACRVAAVSYSFYAQVLFDFNAHSTGWDLLQSLASAELTGGSSFASNAFTTAASLLAPESNSGYRGGKIIAFFLTNDVSQDPPEILEAAVDSLRQYPVELFALGVGDQTSPPELRSIASDPFDKYFVTVPSWDQLTNPVFTDSMTDIACTSPPRPPVTAPTPSTAEPTTTTTRPPQFACEEASFIFILDSSSTFAPNDWVAARDYFAMLIDYIPEESAFVFPNRLVFFD
jgi:hypothetical protein